jgi:hypothetical protein
MAFGGVVAVLALAMGLAWANSRHRGRLSHCRNNLQWLGELAKHSLTEASLNPDLPDFDALKKSRGRAFWMAVWRIKLSKKPREISPFACPFVHPSASLSGSEDLAGDAIDYRGPAHDPFETGEDFTPIGADRSENHGDTLTVLYIRAVVKKRRGRGDDTEYKEFEHKVELIRKGDPRWDHALSRTSD